MGIGIATQSDMEILQTLGQVPLMFIGGMLIVVAVAAVWAVRRARARRV